MDHWIPGACDHSIIGLLKVIHDYIIDHWSFIIYHPVYSLRPSFSYFCVIDINKIAVSKFVQFHLLYIKCFQIIFQIFVVDA